MFMFCIICLKKKQRIDIKIHCVMFDYYFFYVVHEYIFVLINLVEEYRVRTVYVGTRNLFQL